MSTFDGHIREFPDIQVDYFQTTQATASRRPLACFLSHMHSDHLVGLDTLRSPFVYCSAATRAMVLRLEKYPCRINFAKGILEARKQTYKHLKHLLKPLPLETPTIIELSPGNCIQVTLFDANHCPGSVMFLFEDEHKAALYTGDTRLEPWFVNALVRSPCLAEYTAGLRAIDTVYLDTTFLERDVVFQTKAEGLKELLQAVAKYPPETIFYMRAWTFGYEEVWTALAKALRSKIHVDEYKMRLYKSLATGAADPAGERGHSGPQVSVDPMAPNLLGFACANAFHEGSLTMEETYSDRPVRIHSCEKGLGYCSTVRDATRPVVWIRPVVCRLPYGRGEVAELGAGGGGEDLNKEADLEVYGPDEVARLRELVSKSKDLTQGEKDDVDNMLSASLFNDRKNPISFDLDINEEDALEQGTRFSTLPISIKKMKNAVHGIARTQNGVFMDSDDIALPGAGGNEMNLPRNITFPYSRHSSYTEQCDLLDKLRPRDVWPCTVHPEWWFGSGDPITIEYLFGEFCSGIMFRHDVEVASKYSKQAMGKTEDVEILDSQATTDPGHASEDFSFSEVQHESHMDDVDVEGQDLSLPATDEEEDTTTHNVDYPYFYQNADTILPTATDDSQDSQTTQLSGFSRETRLASHQAAVMNAVGAGEWTHIHLASTTDNHTLPDVDLGSG